MGKKVGIFGGSFDPIHEGHIAIAKKALTTAHLDKVVFIPAKQNPLKKISPRASDTQRVEMITRAIASEKNFFVDTCELTRTTPSYTVDTINFLKKQNPEDIFFLIIGADSAESFFSWDRSDEILLSVKKIIVYPRLGATIPEKLLRHVLLLNEELLPFSSTELRSKTHPTHLHPGVVAYIKDHGLYK